MKTYENIKDMGENEVAALYFEDQISESTMEEYYMKTSIYQRNLTNNSVWGQIKPLMPKITSQVNNQITSQE